MIKKKLLKIFQKLFRINLFEVHEKIVAYINSGESLPSALSQEEENELLSRLKNGENDAKNELITHNLRLVVYIAKKFESASLELEDLISVGTIGLIKAVQSFDVDKNIKLATYASRCIENEILMYIRKKSRQNLEVSLDEPLNYDKDGNELLLADVLENENDIVGQNLEIQGEKKILREVISSLREREQRIMELRFGLSGGEESTQKEVADMMGISQSYISRIEKKILSRLKKDLSRLSAN